VALRLIFSFFRETLAGEVVGGGIGIELIEIESYKERLTAEPLRTLSKRREDF
jgi:hypothetical protein